jgi:hypothetical protein
MMALADYVTAAGRMRLGQRRDEALLRWLERNPHSELHEVAEALRSTRRSTHRRLLRLEREGRVRSTLIDGPVFYLTVYEATRP